MELLSQYNRPLLLHSECGVVYQQLDSFVFQKPPRMQGKSFVSRGRKKYVNSREMPKYGHIDDENTNQEFFKG